MGKKRKTTKRSHYEFDNAAHNIMGGKMEKSDGKYPFDGLFYNMAKKKPNDILSTKD
jgi:hypothetical protein